MADIGPDGWERFATATSVDWYLTTDDGGCLISNGRWQATLTPTPGRDPDGLWPMTAAGKVESIAGAKAEAMRALCALRAMRDMYAAVMLDAAASIEDAKRDALAAFNWKRGER